MPRHRFSPDELALLAAIHAAPRDDLPRLVYADWLDENGQPEFAEFIRLQCEHRRWAGHTSAREKELRLKSSQQWSRVQTAGLDWVTFHHLRGLPMPVLYPRTSSMARLDRLAATMSPRFRLMLLIEPHIAYHPEVGPSVFTHPLASKVAVVRFTTADPPLPRLLRDLANSELPSRLDELNLRSQAPEHLRLAESLMAGRCPVRVD